MLACTVRSPGAILPVWIRSVMAHASCRAGQRHAGHLASDGPDEGRQLACDRSGNHRRPLAFARQCAEPPAEPDLRLPRDLTCRARCGSDQSLLLVSDARGMTV